MHENCTGTIVALQDVDQHMYISVRTAESGYGIAGTFHYSLVGDRALFRVRCFDLTISVFLHLSIRWSVGTYIF